MKVVLSLIAIFAWAITSASAGDEPKATYASALAALDAKRPAGYLELAEEILDARSDPDSRRLAVELCVIAHRLDIDDGGDSIVASGACAVLASVPGYEAHSNWLKVMARGLGDSSRVDSVRQIETRIADHSLRYRIAVLIGQLRSGDGIGARASLSKPEIADSVKSMGRLFISLGVIADPDEMARQAARWPCPDCGNDRLVRKTQAGAGAAWRICPSCGGVPGPRLFRSELLSSLRVESELLEGSQRSWAAQLSMDFGAPLVDPIPETVARVFRVDPSLCVFRDGRWIKPE